MADLGGGGGGGGGGNSSPPLFPGLTWRYIRAITNKESVADLGGGGVAIPLPLYFLALRGAI